MSKGKEIPWTEEEKEYLVNNYSRYTAKEMAAFLGRSKYSIKGMTQFLGLRKRLDDDLGVSWSVEEVSFLKENYGKLSIREISVSLGRSMGSIFSKVKKLGIRINKTISFNRWSIEEVEFLKNNYPKLKSSEICVLMGRTKKAVDKKLNSLGIRKSDNLDLEFVKKAFAEKGFTVISDKYVNSRTLIRCRCSKGHEFELVYNSFKTYNCGCQKCYYNVEDAFKGTKNLLEAEGFIVLETDKDYKGYNHKIRCICSCGHTCFISRNMILHNTGCKVCHISNNTSKEEKRLLEDISLISNVDMYQNVRNLIYPFEVDIYIPTLKAGIEFCGLRWHDNKTKEYHVNKYDMCDKKGVNLITVFEDEYFISKENVVDKILIASGLKRSLIKPKMLSFSKYAGCENNLVSFCVDSRYVSNSGFGLFNDSGECCISVLFYLKKYSSNAYVTSININKDYFNYNVYKKLMTYSFLEIGRLGFKSVILSLNKQYDKFLSLEKRNFVLLRKRETKPRLFKAKYKYRYYEDSFEEGFKKHSDFNKFYNIYDCGVTVETVSLNKEDLYDCN